MTIFYTKREEDFLREKLVKSQEALKKVRDFIVNCDHEPAVDEIDAALSNPTR